MTPYEILLMLDPELPDERQSEIVSRTRDLIERGGGSWDAHDVWGRRKLAYEIDHKTDGAYHLLTFSAEPEASPRSPACSRSRTASCATSLFAQRASPGGTVAPPPEDRQDAPEPATVAAEEE